MLAIAGGISAAIRALHPSEIATASIGPLFAIIEANFVKPAEAMMPTAFWRRDTITRRDHSQG
jgi:hypothetical protein